MDKIKNIGLKIFDWGKRHRVLSVLLCLLLIVFCFKGIVWIYNDIAYGRFVKVGNIEDIQQRINLSKSQNIRLLAINNNILLIFIPYELKNRQYYKIYRYIVSKNQLENLGVAIESRFILPFKKNDEEILILAKQYPNKFNLYDFKLYLFNYNHINNLLQKYKFEAFDFTQDSKAISLTNTETLIFANEKTDKKPVLYKYQQNIDGENFSKLLNYDFNSLLLRKEKDKNILIVDKYNFKIKKYLYLANKIINIDTKEIEAHTHCNNLNYHSFFNWINDKEFVIFEYEPKIFHKTVYIYLFKFEDNTVYLKSKKNIKFNLFINPSFENRVVLNNKQILFIGGWTGNYQINWPSKQSYIYNIDNEKFIKINNYPITIQKAIIYNNHMKNPIIFGGETGNYFRKRPSESIYIFKPKNIEVNN